MSIWRNKPCHYCKGAAGTTDHIVPRALGGRSSGTNTVPACADCNNKKADAFPKPHCDKCRRAINLWYLMELGYDQRRRSAFLVRVADRVPPEVLKALGVEIPA